MVLLNRVKNEVIRKVVSIEVLLISQAIASEPMALHKSVAMAVLLTFISKPMSIQMLCLS